MAWYIAGPLIGLIFLTITYLGKSFGVSSIFENLCEIDPKIGGIKQSFQKNQWRYLFIIGMMIGAAIISQIDPNLHPLFPAIINWSSLDQWQNWLILAGGGFLVGFGSRYAGGCTSGHAITGLSSLQIPSLVAVIGFFIGGLFIVHVIYPLIF
jgi:hypothetical protein